MNRQIRRKIKRLWEKIPCFSDCTIKVDIETLPNTAVDFFLKVSEDLMLQYNLNWYQRWRLYPVVMVDGFPFRDTFLKIGMASDDWMDEYFDDERFEGWNRYL